MPLIFIALFLGSFLIGAGTGYVTQGQGGFGGTPPVSQGTPTPYATPDPQKACFPKVEANNKIFGDEIIIEAKEFVKKPLDFSCNEQDIANGGQGPCCANATNVCNVGCIDETTKCERDGVTEMKYDNYIYDKDNYQKILDHLFGKNGIEETTVVGGVTKKFNRDRTTHNWILVKKDAWMPSWKIAFSSGHSAWSIPTAWISGGTQVHAAQFREATRIGYVNPISTNSWTSTRYADNSQGVGDIWIANGWCPSNSPGSAADPRPVDDAQVVCTDPLIRNVLLVVSKKGFGPRSGRGWGSRDQREPADLGTTEQRIETWWRFDVYYDAATLLQRAQTRGSTIPTNDDLPCWMRVACVIPEGDPMDPAGRRSNFEAWGDKTCTELITITPPLGAYKGPLFSESIISLINKPVNKIVKLTKIFSTKFNELITVLKLSKEVSAQTTILFPQFVSGKSIIYTNPSDPRLDKIKLNTYFIATLTTLPTGTEKIGYVTGTGGNNFDIHAVIIDLTAATLTAPPSPTPNEYVGLQIIYLVDSSGQARQYLFVHRESGQGETLKLRTFYPPLIETEIPQPPPLRFAYEWYTPACKPAIYLYPEKETALSVYVKPQGRLTESIPVYNSGWENVLAKPDGTLVYKGLSLPYLYYEAEVKNVNPPTQGWVVKKEDLPGFFNTTLPYLGLNSTEITDFKNYWLKKLTDKPYYFAGLIDRKILDEKEKIEFSIKPDQFIRVRFYFSGLDKPIIAAPPLLSKTPQRDGFTAVDWGGIIAGGTCSSEDTQIVQ